jgi:hypothetical protein
LGQLSFDASDDPCDLPGGLDEFGYVLFAGDSGERGEAKMGFGFGG